LWLKTLDQKNLFVYNCSYSSKLTTTSERENMNVKVKAGVIVAGFLAGSIAISGALRLVAPYITPEIAGNVLMFGSMAVLLYVMYILVLDQLKIDAKIQDLVDQKSK
jgi:hypothetical protein